MTDSRLLDSLARSLRSPLTGPDVETAAAVADPRLDAAAVHAAVAEREREVAVDVAAHRGHRQIGVEAARHFERDVAAHGVEHRSPRPVNSSTLHVDVAAHGVAR